MHKTVLPLCNDQHSWPGDYVYRSVTNLLMPISVPFGEVQKNSINKVC